MPIDHDAGGIFVGNEFRIARLGVAVGSDKRPNGSGRNSSGEMSSRSSASTRAMATTDFSAAAIASVSTSSDRYGRLQAARLLGAGWRPRAEIARPASRPSQAAAGRSRAGAERPTTAQRTETCGGSQHADRRCSACLVTFSQTRIAAARHRRTTRCTGGRAPRLGSTVFRGTAFGGRPGRPRRP